MKKILVLMMSLVMTVSLVACGGDKSDSAASSPNAKVDKTAEFTDEQQAFAKEFAEMVDAYNEVVDKINANSEILNNEELVAIMNEISAEITEADNYFTSPETLTNEIMESLKVAIDLTYDFIAEAEALLAETEN